MKLSNAVRAVHKAESLANGDQDWRQHVSENKTFREESQVSLHEVVTPTPGLMFAPDAVQALEKSAGPGEGYF